MSLFKVLCTVAVLSIGISISSNAVVLYDQDFEAPTGFTNNGADLDGQAVNNLYGNQPAGFVFANSYTVETLLITGALAHGTGFSDPSGEGGNYAIGMLSSAQDDRLGLSFDVGTNDFLNLRIDISSIDLSCCGGYFVSPGAIPTFRFTLFDNPTGVAGIGGGTILDQLDGIGTASDRDVFDWTEILIGLDATGSTNGNVILQIDLLSGGYAAFDNLRIAASDTSGDVGDDDGDSVPEPGVLGLFGFGLLGFGILRRRRRT